MITHETYYADRSHLSTSAMKNLLRGFLNFNHALTTNSDRPAFIEGRALHSAVLTPYLNEVSPSSDHAATRYKLPAKVWENHLGMVNALRSDATVIELLRNAKTEQIYTSIVDGVKMKCMVDADLPNIICDIKTCEDSSADGFRRAARKFHYDLQAANYIDITGKGAFIFIAVEKKAPYNIGIYQAPLSMIESGREKRQRCIEVLKKGKVPTLIQEMEW